MLMETSLGNFTRLVFKCFLLPFVSLVGHNFGVTKLTLKIQIDLRGSEGEKEK